MDMTIIARVALVITALAPTAVIVGAAALWRGDMTTVGGALLTTLVLVALCLRVVHAIRGPHTSAPAMHQITSIEPMECTNSTIILIYAAPALMLCPAPDWSDWNIWGPTLVVLIAITALGRGWAFNPLLRMCGWRLYRVGTPENVTRLLISRRIFRTGNQTITGVELGDSLIMDVG